MVHKPKYEFITECEYHIQQSAEIQAGPPYLKTVAECFTQKEFLSSFLSTCFWTKLGL